ncbi:metallophosphoesterase [Fusobacterium sp. PH5-44]|uniref:metallophosphoesterase n=1 Tax=unclassified Fusobacterium TaxID=2648384 RepID=UPI003D22471A
MIKFAIIALSVIAVVTAIISITLGRNVFLNSSKIVYSLFLGLYLICVIVYAIGDKLPFSITRNFYKVTYVYFSIIFYLGFFFLLSKIILIFINVKYIYHFSLVITILLIIFGNIMRHKTTITEYNINTKKKLPKEDLKIALISDTHFGYIIDHDDMNSLVKQLNELKVDIVLYPGDFADREVQPLLKMDLFSGMKEIRTEYGVFLSLGNHDLFDNKTDVMVEKLAINDVKVLRDEKFLIENMLIIGKDWGSKMDLSKIVSDDDKNKYSMYIYHEPKEENINEAVKNNIDLMVSGHTHGGQMFPINFVTKLIFPVHYGYRRFGHTDVIVTSGVGIWGPPLRIGSKSEIVIINLKHIE